MKIDPPFFIVVRAMDDGNSMQLEEQTEFVHINEYIVVN